jgi:hypothetical protein
MVSLSLSFFCCAGSWTQDFAHARQELYSWVTSLALYMSFFKNQNNFWEERDALFSQIEVEYREAEFL